MNILITYARSAFKHGITEENIKCAMKSWVYDDVMDDEDEKYLLIGFDKNGNLLEIMYNIINEQSIKVFHAMKCRNHLLSLLTNLT